MHRCNSSIGGLKKEIKSNRLLYPEECRENSAALRDTSPSTSSHFLSQMFHLPSLSSSLHCSGCMRSACYITEKASQTFDRIRRWRVTPAQNPSLQLIYLLLAPTRINFHRRPFLFVARLAPTPPPLPWCICRLSSPRTCGLTVCC
jgi:hypothetical protein